MNDAWDDDVLYSPDPPEHGARCPYGHPDATTLGYCRAEAQRMVDGMRAQLRVAQLRHDMGREWYLRRDLTLWETRLA